MLKVFPTRVQKKTQAGKMHYFADFFLSSVSFWFRFVFFWILLLFLGSSYLQIVPPPSWRSSPVLLASLGSVWLLLALPARRISRRVFLRPGPFVVLITIPISWLAIVFKGSRDLQAYAVR